MPIPFPNIAIFSRPSWRTGFKRVLNLGFLKHSLTAAPLSATAPRPGAMARREGHLAFADHTGAAAPRTRPGKPDELRLEDLGADPFDRLTLRLMRWHFQGFADPSSQGWLSALRVATVCLGREKAPLVCYDIVALVEVIRANRQSNFRFNPDGCNDCRQWATPEERRILALMEALRGGRIGLAQTHAQLLCDGKPAPDLARVATIYLQRHAGLAEAAVARH